ncbi:MAG: alpha/beta fold hydrolase [Candidatus Helarchaeota archaeon]
MISKKIQYILLAIFIGLSLTSILILNLYPSNVVRSTHVAYSDQKISFNLYQPKGLSQPTPVVVMGHGIIVNKEMMTNFAIELANRGFIVANLDWSGHGQSSGYWSNLTADLEAVIAAVPGVQPLANMSALALMGYSMGGFSTYPYSVNNTNIKAWVGVGTLADGVISNTTTPSNVLMVVGSLDEAIPLYDAKVAMVNLTGLPSVNDVEVNTLYGSIDNGTARMLHVAPGVDHLITPWSEEVVRVSVDWITLSFGQSLPTAPNVYHLRNLFAWIGFMSTVGLVFTTAAILADKMNLKKSSDETPTTDKTQDAMKDQSLLSFVGKYYLFTFLLLPTIFIFVPTLFLFPLPLTTALSALVGCLGVNLLIYSWRLSKKWNCSLKTILKDNLFQKPKIWIYAAILTAIFFVCYYLTIGLNYLGMIPSIQRIPYLVVIMVLSFIVFWIYSIFIQKFSAPYLEKKFQTNTTVQYLVISLVNTLLIDSWFVIIIITPCILMGNYFFAMILILMIPIFLFMNYFGVYMEKLTGSTIPNALLHAILLSFIIVTLSPYANLMSFFGIFMH